jgi:hypothetical protein
VDDFAAGRRHIETEAAPALAKARWIADAFGRGLPYSVAKYRGRSYAEQAARALRGADLVVVDHAQAGGIRDSTAGLPFVHIAHNVEHEVYAGQAARAAGPGRRLLEREARLVEALERRLASQATAVWCLTASDAERFEALGAHRAIALEVPGRPTAGAEARARDGVALIGNWTWEPNAVGLRWFAHEVAPLLDPALPVTVAGAGAEWIDADSRLRWLGRVDDAAAFLAGARVVAIPAQAGGGIQVKTLDALAQGSWVVATPAAMRGIDEPPESVQIVEDGRAFARAVEVLARNPATLEPSTAALEWSSARAAAFAAAVAAEAASATAA